MRVPTSIPHLPLPLFHGDQYICSCLTVYCVMGSENSFSPLYALFTILDIFRINSSGNFLIGFHMFSELVFQHTIPETTVF